MSTLVDSSYCNLDYTFFSKVTKVKHWTIFSIQLWPQINDRYIDRKTDRCTLDAKMQFVVYHILTQLQPMMNIDSSHIKITKHRCIFVNEPSGFELMSSNICLGHMNTSQKNISRLLLLAMMEYWT